MPAIGVDFWAALQANRIAAETGWRKSEIYAWIISARKNAVTLVGAGDSELLIVTRGLDLIRDSRIFGESFNDTAKRVNEMIAESMDGSGGKGH